MSTTANIKYSYIVQWSWVGSPEQHEDVYDTEAAAWAKYCEIEGLGDLQYHRLYSEGEYYMDGQPIGEFQAYERLA